MAIGAAVGADKDWAVDADVDATGGSSTRGTGAERVSEALVWLNDVRDTLLTDVSPSSSWCLRHPLTDGAGDALRDGGGGSSSRDGGKSGAPTTFLRIYANNEHDANHKEVIDAPLIDVRVEPC